MQTPTLDITLPCEIELEWTLAGSIISHPQLVPNVLSRLHPDDFYAGKIKIVMEIVYGLHQNGGLVDLFMVERELKRAGHYEKGFFSDADIVELFDRNTLETDDLIEHYAECIKEAAIRRDLMGIYSKAIGDLNNELEDVPTIVSGINDEVYSILDVGEDKSISDELGIIMKMIESGETCGLSTGFDALDAATSGWQDSELYILAGRPGMGKTAMACKLIKNVIEEGTFVYFMSLEMQKRQVLLRLLSLVGQIPYQYLRQPTTVGDGLIENTMKTASQIIDWNWILDDTSGISVSDIVARIEAANHKEKIGFVVVDHLHQIPTVGYGKNNNEAYGTITLALKNMAKRLECPVMCLCQLNRNLELRSNKRPQLSDLRESGSIEQNGDNVWFLYREDYYSDMPNQPIEPAELIIAKNKSLPVGTVKLEFRGAFMEFVEVNDE